MYAFFVSDDLLRGVPREKRMPIERIVTSGMRALYDPDRDPGVGYPDASMHKELVDTSDRVHWLDDQGIDVQNFFSGTAYTLARAIKDPVLGMETLQALNTWLTDRSASVRNRLVLAANVRFEDLDWAVRELTRLRERGSRTFLLPSEPTGDTPPNRQLRAPVVGGD